MAAPRSPRCFWDRSQGLGSDHCPMMGGLCSLTQVQTLSLPSHLQSSCPQGSWGKRAPVRPWHAALGPEGSQSAVPCRVGPPGRSLSMEVTDKMTDWASGRGEGHVVTSWTQEAHLT